jgi:hypothetical protein
MTSALIDAWKRERRKALWLSVVLLIPLTSVAWLAISHFDEGLARYGILAALILGFASVVLVLRKRLARLSICPGCGAVLFDVLALQANTRLSVNYCPSCGRRV